MKAKPPPNEEKHPLGDEAKIALEVEPNRKKTSEDQPQKDLPC